MSYRSIKYGHITDSNVRDMFHRADVYISDTYSMFHLPLKGRRSGGKCDFPIVLTLLCVVDRMAKYVYPTDDQQKRFKKLLRVELFWGPSNKKWMDRGQAAKMLYVQFRNSLVHQLGQDDPSTNPLLKEQPVIGKWGLVPQGKRTIDRVDRLKKWDESWATMYLREQDGRESVKLCSAALYWSVKDMVARLAERSP